MKTTLEYNPPVFCSQSYKYIATPSFSDVLNSDVTKPIYQTSKARWKNYAKNFDSILVHLDRFIDDKSITLERE